MSCEAWRTAAFILDDPIVSDEFLSIYTLLNKGEFSIFWDDKLYFIP
jgi:hypothetical protein